MSQSSTNTNTLTTNTNTNNNNNNKKKPLSTHLIAGGGAGFMEALICHPLDTIKVRMQLKSSSSKTHTTPNRFLGVGMGIVKREGVVALYKGLGAVVTGIVPKMSIRFFSFELYKDLLKSQDGGNTMGSVFVSGLMAGVTEAVLVVTPMDVLKIRLQAQRHSLADPLDYPKYRNVGHAAYTIIKEEGPSALYKGVTLTALRQSTNQAVNFTAYQKMKQVLFDWQEMEHGQKLPSYQHLIAGGLSGILGPLSNAPIDTIKTRIQRQPALKSESGYARMSRVTMQIWRDEGWRAFYKGLTPRLLRVAPGQAITFMVYERIQMWLDTIQFYSSQSGSQSSQSSLSGDDDDEDGITNTSNE